jgi:Na+-transporting methylmalonyl-CoA/oxaloacetate decarboxylase gamma subunit
VIVSHVYDILRGSGESLDRHTNGPKPATLPPWITRTAYASLRRRCMQQEVTRHKHDGRASFFGKLIVSPNILSLPIVLAVSDDHLRALQIAFAGLSIVFLALVLITVFIATLPRLLSWLDVVWPESEDVHAAPVHSKTVAGDEEALIAAIGFVLHTELQRQLADEQNSGTRKD